MKSYKHRSSYDRSSGGRGCLFPAILIVLICLFLMIVIKMFFLPNQSEDKDAIKSTIEKKVEKEDLIIPKVQKSEGEESEYRKVRNASKIRSETTPVQVTNRRHYEIKDKDLIAFYPFNGNPDDESGYENHGTVYGATLAGDRFGNEDSAYSFDGVNDYIDIGHPLISWNFTICFWVKSNGAQNKFAVPVSQGNMAYKGFSFTFTNERYNGFSWGTWNKEKDTDPNWGKSDWYTLDFHYLEDIDSDLTWHFLAATFENETVTVYKDGKFQGSAVGFPINFGRFDFNIGRASANSDFNHRSFNGIIDDVRIYKRALSKEEIASMY